MIKRKEVKEDGKRFGERISRFEGERGVADCSGEIKSRR
jgi:hypothetical protein